MVNNDIYTQLVEDFGLDVILEQNDIEPWQVVKLLHTQGYLDLEDYFYDELELGDED